MNRIKQLSISLMLLLISVIVFGQKENNANNPILKKNTIDLTVGGSGLFLSINYSRIVLVKSNYFLNASIGLGVIPIVGGTTIPHMLTANFGKKSSFLELGLAGTYWTGESNTSENAEKMNSYNLSPIIGWRKQFENNLLFRVYTNPLINISGENYIENHTVLPYMGISLGYSF
jgi:hypothetical protein